MKPRVYGLSFRPSSSTSRPSLQVATMPHESGQSYAHTLRYLPSASIGSSTVQGTNSIPENQVDEGDDVAPCQLMRVLHFGTPRALFSQARGAFPEPFCSRPLSPFVPRILLSKMRGVLQGEGRSEGSFCPK